MKSTENWWNAEIDWSAPAGQLLEKFVASLPANRTFRITIFGSAPLQLTVDRTLLSADVDLFSDEADDLNALVASAKLGNENAGLHIEVGYELSFRTSPKWRPRAKIVQLGNGIFTLPHPIDILIGKLARLEAKDILAFKRTMERFGHPTAEEFRQELVQAVDLFSPGFDADNPSRYKENTERLWHEVFNASIDVQREIIEPALRLRTQGYGIPPKDYKRILD